MPPGADTEFIKWFATLGIGGVLAGFMFVFYRKDVKQYTELWKIQTERVEVLVERVISVIKENTTSNVKLIALIENQERNALRKEDIETLINRRIRESKET
jgi:hypothetical protein